MSNSHLVSVSYSIISPINKKYLLKIKKEESKLKMTSLQALHKSMLQIGSDMQQFQVELGVISFDCLFSIRDTPHFVISLTLRGDSPKFFLFHVKQGYWISPFFGDFYSDLAKVLNTGKHTGQKLMPKEFLENLNSKIPQKATKNHEPSAQKIIQLRPDITEERERPYFNTWIYWKKSSNKGPTKNNKHKTLMLLGAEALHYSIEKNASSRWSATEMDKSWLI